MGGFVYRIECAVRADGSSPAKEFIADLRTGNWEADPDVDDLPSDEQIDDWSKLKAAMQAIADYSSPDHNGQLNYLGSGIWEFKGGTKRIAFYDTPGDGTYEEKPRFRYRDQSDRPDDDYWQVPDFDENIRLLNAWGKVGDRANAADIDLAIQIREEDVAYDREDG